jgi:hypothetical protein
MHGSREKVGETLSQKTSLAWWLMPVIPVTQEAKAGRFWSEAGSGQKLEILSKTN